MSYALYINTVYQESSSPHVTASDRAFRYGDGVFETIRLVAGSIWQEAFHRQRFQHVLKDTGLDGDDAALWGFLQDCATKHQHGLLRVAVTRGQGGRGYLPPKDTQRLEVVEWFAPVDVLPRPSRLYFSSWRRPLPDNLPNSGKIASSLNAVLARREAAAQGMDEALLCNSLGWVAEASSASIFWRVDDRWFTPSLASGALDGSVRYWLMQRLPVREGLWRLTRLLEADAVAIANLGHGICAVTQLEPHGQCWVEDPEIHHLQRDLCAEWGIHA